MRERRWGGWSGLTVVGLAIVGAFIVVAVLAPVLAPHDPKALSGDALELPSARHLFGTNDIGQDNFSQVIWGSRSSLGVAVSAGALAMALGTLLGVGGGLLGGWADAVVVRAVDLLLAMPALPVLLMVAAIAGPSRVVVVLVIGLLAWPFNARILRSQTLSLRQRGFVDAAAGFGAGPLYVVRRHLVPALGPVIVIGFVSVAGVAVVLDAGLAFLGLGDPTGVSWGLVLNRALRHRGLYFTPLWTWWVLPAGFAVTLAILGFTFLGLGLETRLNPRLGRAK
jgi:peptide/nickel transport system permease protein